MTRQSHILSAGAGGQIEGRAIFSQQIVNGLMLGSIYAMVGVALTLSIGVLKFLNFSIPGLFMIGGMSTWALIRHRHAVAARRGLRRSRLAAAASLVVERFTWRWMRNAQEFVPLVSSMAFLILFENLAVAYWGSDLQSVPRLFGSADWRIGGLVISIPQLSGLAASVVLIWACRCFSPGRGSAADCAPSPRIPTRRFCSASISTASCRLCSSSAACSRRSAGVLFALNYRQVHPFMGEALGLKGISAMVVGGMGNIWGAIAGGLIIGMTEVLCRSVSRRRLRRHLGLRAAAAHSDRAADRPVRRRERGSARMSGYLEGVLVLLAINVVLRLRARSCRSRPVSSISASPASPRSAVMPRPISAPRSRCRRWSPFLWAVSLRDRSRLPWRSRCCGRAASISRSPPSRLGEIVRASILNLDVVGGAAGYPVTAFIRLPTIAMFALGVTVLVCAAVCDPLWHRDHRGP